jgi:hypothetical protein
MAWIDWDAIIAALDSGHLPASGGGIRMVRIAASLAAGHPVSLRDAVPGLDQVPVVGADELDAIGQFAGLGWHMQAKTTEHGSAPVPG